jgi:hypothetical protein
MLSPEKRGALREISRLLKISCNTVRRVLRKTSPPQPEPTRKWQSVVSPLPELYSRARGNAVRIQELVAEELGVAIPYSTLTHLLRREQLRTPVPKRSGIYPYEPGAEMHRDTSPHRLEIAGKRLTAQCAGLILPFSRFGFVQYYPTFTRFEAKVFLTAAFRFLGATCPRCTSLVGKQVEVLKYYERVVVQFQGKQPQIRLLHQTDLITPFSKTISSSRSMNRCW